MRRVVRIVVTGAALAVPLIGTPAWAEGAAAGTFGQHVSQCAQQVGFSGDHNPGMHRGAAGWDGMTCPD